MRKSLLGLSLALTLFSAPVWADKIAPIYAQTHWNAQMQCQDLEGVSRRLEELVLKHGGRVQNLNCDLRSGSGSLTARIPEPEMLAFCGEMKSLGSLVQQNRSLSDNTSSYLEAKRQLALAEKMASAHVPAPAGVTESERALFEAEFKAYLRDRINNQRSTMAQYEQNQGWAEISLNLQGPAVAQPAPESGRRSESLRAVPPPPQAVSAAPPAVSHEWAVLGGAALMLSGTIFYLIRRS